MKQLHALLLLAVFALAGCAGVPRATEPLKISLSDLTLLEVGLIEQRIGLKLRVLNPNAFDIPIEGLTYQLTLNERPFAEGVARPQAMIPAYGEAVIETEAVSNLAHIVRQLEAMQQAGALRYRLQGKADLGGYRGRVPFVMDGEIALPQAVREPQP